MPGSTAATPHLQIVPARPPTVADLIGMPWDDYLKLLEADEVAWRDEEAQRGLKAMRLAPDLRVYRALLNGQQVPLSALQQDWAKRYGLLL